MRPLPNKLKQMRNNKGKTGENKSRNRANEKGIRGKRSKPGENNPKFKETGRKSKFKTKDKRKTTRPTKTNQGNSEGIRLNRYISNSGVCSRREADEFIKAGVVTINGKAVTELGTKVVDGDIVKFDGRTLYPEKKVYVLLNKPKNYVTTTDDPHADKIVMDLVKNACSERIYPVGRLDRNTTGVLLFTNDGELSKRLTHPSYSHKKIYHVTLDKSVTKQHIVDIANGIELEDGPIAADAISYISPDNKLEVGIEIHSGKNRIVRRIFEHFGYHVRKLDRVYFAGLTKKNLPRGKWRILSQKEVGFLKMAK